jgi:hypothetical protein
VYGCEAHFFIEHLEPGRNLVVQYGPGYTGPHLPVAKNGRPEFKAGIPEDWTEKEVTELVLTPPLKIKETEHLKNYPVWEAGARYFGLHYLVRPTAAPKLSEDTSRH